MNFRVVRQRAGHWVMGRKGMDVREQDVLMDSKCPWCEFFLDGRLPRVCMNCYHLGTDNDHRYCRKGVMFPTNKGTCYRYEGWL